MVLLMVATMPSTWLGLRLWLLGCAVGGCPGGSKCPHQGELLGAHGLLLFLIGVGWMDVGEKCVPVGEDLRAVGALQLNFSESWGWAVSMWFFSILAWLKVSL